jgi:hypothetical protein
MRLGRCLLTNLLRWNTLLPVAVAEAVASSLVAVGLVFGVVVVVPVVI